MFVPLQNLLCLHFLAYDTTDDPQGFLPVVISFEHNGGRNLHKAVVNAFLKLGAEDQIRRERPQPFQIRLILRSQGPHLTQAADQILREAVRFPVHRNTSGQPFSQSQHMVRKLGVQHGDFFRQPRERQLTLKVNHCPQRAAGSGIHQFRCGLSAVAIVSCCRLKRGYRRYF
ncbi:hypothetical protein D3C75_860510 [compost metagenome]